MKVYHYLFEGKIRPFGFILMTKKDRNQYKKLFEFLRDGLDIVPGTIMCDFEAASRRAAREVWNGVKVYGCNFHYCQALSRKAKKFARLRKALNVRGANNNAKKALKMFMRLSLLPIRHVYDGIRAIRRFITRHRMNRLFAGFYE